MTRQLGDLTCAIGGCPMWAGKGALPQGEAICRRCRKKRREAGSARKYTRGGTPKPRPRKCPGCGDACWGLRCRSCADKAMRIRPDSDPRVQRADREKSAPGLGRRDRERLAIKWRKQGRTCAYCPALATTIDHVIPLIRGGTNHEGNLVPCCKTCNSRKSYRYISEMRHDWHVTGSGEIGWQITPRKPRRKRKREWVDAPLSLCPCGALHTRPRYCSDECGYEYGVKQYARNRYRDRVGIPREAPIGTRAA